MLLSYLHSVFHSLGPFADRYIWLQRILQLVFADLPNLLYSPPRLSGSAVESLFSQYKHNSGGKLDSVNYTTARAAHLVKQSISEHHSGKGYRDEALNTFEIPLRKKTYNKCTHTKNDE